MDEIQKTCNKLLRHNHLVLKLYLAPSAPPVTTQSLHAVGYYDFRITYN
jgi:hypothetical protein